MRRLAVTVIALLTLGAAGCSSEPSYQEVVKQCAAALQEQQEDGKTGKPAECEGVKEDDYTALSVSAAIDGLGWTNSNGDFDEDKMLDSVTETP